MGRLMLPGMFNSHAPRFVWLDQTVAIYLVLFCLIAAGWWRFVAREREVYGLALPF
jgi:hypothetical protein